jgi:hypothetical protein
MGGGDNTGRLGWEMTKQKWFTRPEHDRLLANSALLTKQEVDWRAPRQATVLRDGSNDE